MASRTIRSIAAGLALGVSAVGLGAMAPAQAELADTPFTCTVSILGEQEFITSADTDLPATVEQGSTTPVKFTAKITVPENVVSTARFFYGQQVDGNAVVTNTVNDVEQGDATAEIPLTTLPESGAMTLEVSGTAPAYKADTLGTKVVKLSKYTATLFFTKDGVRNPDGLVLPCVAPANADTTVDTFEVVEGEAPAVQATKTKANVKYKKKAKKVVAKVTVTNEDGTPATGKAKVILKKGKKKAAQANVKLNKKGKAKKVFKKVAKKGKYTLVVQYKGSDVSKKSKKKVKFRVK